MANYFKAKPKAKTTGQLVSLTIEKLDNNCTGVAYVKRKPMFVSGSLIGEQVIAKVTEEKSKYAIAQLVEVKQVSDHRIAAPCSHFLKCGGCDIQHLAQAQHIELKTKKVIEYFSRQEISTELPWQKALTSDEYGYRRKARIGVQYDKTGQAIVGFRKKSTNELISIKSCLVLDEQISRIFKPLRELIAKLSLSKSIGHIEVIATEKVTLVVRQLVKLNVQDRKRWFDYATLHDWQVLFDDGNELTPLVEGNDKSLTYTLFDGTIITFQASDFIQVNDAVNNKMIAQAIDWLELSSSDKVLDLFCGLGNFSLPIAKKVKSVVGIEGVQKMVDSAGLNAEKNNVTNCYFYQANLNASWDKSNWINQSFDKVVLDPARAGALEALPEIIKLKVNTILYVSCDASTLARDSKTLLNQGYKIEKIAVMDMFSQTKHIETMVLFKSI